MVAIENSSDSDESEQDKLESDRENHKGHMDAQYQETVSNSDEADNITPSTSRESTLSAFVMPDKKMDSSPDRTKTPQRSSSDSIFSDVNEDCSLSGEISPQTATDSDYKPRIMNRPIVETEPYYQKN